MPTIDLTDDELAAITAVIRRAIEEDKFPRAPRLEPLRSALAKLECGSSGAQAARWRPKTPSQPLKSPKRPPTGLQRPSTPGANCRRLGDQSPGPRPAMPRSRFLHPRLSQRRSP